MKQENNEMTLEEAKIAIRIANKKKELERERAELFGILWVVLGGIFAALTGDIVTGGFSGLICAAVYAFVFHGRKSNDS